MNEGKLIEYIEQGALICTLCLQDKGNKLHLLTPTNREVNLPPKRAVLISGVGSDTEKPREQLLEELKHKDRVRTQLKDRVNVEELWELVRDEGERFDYKDLAQLAFGEDITDDHVSALVRALFEDRLRFKFKDGCFLPNSEERVEQIAKQREEEALKEERLRQGAAWIKGIFEGKRVEEPLLKDDIVEMLVQLVLYGNDAADFKTAKELLSRAGITNTGKAKYVLLRLGVWEEDENLDLHRLGVGKAFSEEHLAQSAKVVQTEVDAGDREDLTHLPVVTVDGPETRDYDDALSVEVSGNVLHVGVHIADVASAIAPGSSLDREAAERASSIYLPRKQIPMLPPELSQDALSLKEGKVRKAVSLLTRFDSDGVLLDYRFVPSLVRVERRLTYEELDGRLEGEFGLDRIYRLCRKLRQDRVERGALNLSLKELVVKVEEDESVSLERVDQNAPPRMMVAEMMILYNHLAASFCRDRQIPALYRTQAEPSERLIQEEAGGYLFYVFRQRRKLSPMRMDTAPSRHSGLGLEAYTHATSPIRRYLDVLVQRQIGNSLLGLPLLYSKEDLEKIAMRVEPVVRDLARMKRNRLRYWVLKYLRQNPNGVYSAMVLDELKSKYRVVLTDFLQIAEMGPKNGLNLRPGQEVMIQVKKADPWENQLEIVKAD